MIRPLVLAVSAIALLKVTPIYSKPVAVLSLDFEMKTLDGASFNFGERYRGKAVLIVNLPYRCSRLSAARMQGYQRLHDEYCGRGLLVVGVPCGRFATRYKVLPEQAPTAREFQKCCEKNHSVSYDLVEVSDVAGKSQSPLYAYLLAGMREKQRRRGEPVRVKWDYEAFLLNREGRFVQHFRSDEPADSAAVVSAIERALSESPDAQRSAQ